MKSAAEKNREFLLWRVSIDAWKSGAVVTDFMREQVHGLLDADGYALSEDAKAFFEDLLFVRIKPRKGLRISKTLIRRLFKDRLFSEQHNVAGDPRMTPTERAIQSIADEVHASFSTISLIVYPRKSRKT